MLYGNPNYAQNCTQGFFCEAGSSVPVGMGLCPQGYYCPAGTPVPVPTPQGTFAELNGTVNAATCAAGYYAPTIQVCCCAVGAFRSCMLRTVPRAISRCDLCAWGTDGALLPVPAWHPVRE